MKKIGFITVLFMAVFFITGQTNDVPKGFVMDKVVKSDNEWQTCLTPEQYQILREKGTEMAFTGKYYKHKDKGTYICAGCENELFSSDTKYDSGSGWPSFWEPSQEENIETEQDHSAGMVRTEVHCSKCEAHLGHVFPDGPQPTGLRYCINSVSLDLKPTEEE